MKMLFIVLLSLVAFPAFAQHSAVSADKMNVFYIGVSNLVTVMAEGHNCNVITPEAEGCTFTHKEDCSYEVMVTEPGNVDVKVKVKNAGKTKIVGVHPFRVKYLPDPTARVGRKESGTVSKAELKANIGMAAVLKGFDIEAKYRVTNFYMIVIRNGKPILSRNNQGAIFDDTTRAYIAELQKDDKVIFADIHCIGPDKKERQLAAVELTIE